MKMPSLIAAAFTIVAPACSGTAETVPPSPAAEVVKPLPVEPVEPVAAVDPPSLPKGDPGASIGSASMDKDGTLRLQLRAEGAGGAVGDALLIYPPTHADYAKIKKHVEAGGPPMQPGETRPVLPF